MMELIFGFSKEHSAGGSGAFRRSSSTLNKLRPLATFYTNVTNVLFLTTTAAPMRHVSVAADVKDPLVGAEKEKSKPSCRMNILL